MFFLGEVIRWKDGKMGKWEDGTVGKWDSGSILRAVGSGR